MQFVPESAQFYMTKGENGKAMKVMETVAHFNGKILPKVIHMYCNFYPQNVGV